MTAGRQSRNPLKVGDSFVTNDGSECVVVSYGHAKDVTVRFVDDHCHEVKTSSNALREGRVKNPFAKSVYGVGYMGVGKYKSRTPHYSRWLDMMRRCYSERFKSGNASYVGCTVHEEWHNFQNFSAWLDLQPQLGRDGFELDKDVAVRGNKEYSPNACSLIPKRINAIVCAYLDSRTPSGVYFIVETGRFAAQCRNADYKKSHLGVFSSQDEASEAYEKFKSSVMRTLAERYRDDLTNRAYESLMNYGDRL